MRVVIGSLVLATLFSLTSLPNAHAQGSATSTISGVVKDEGGGVLPGANVVAASNATGTQVRSGHQRPSGSFAIPSLSAGLYTITVSLPGFKTSVIKDVRVQLGVPTAISARVGRWRPRGNHHS